MCKLLLHKQISLTRRLVETRYCAHMEPSRPIETDIVLLGAGHAHVEVLRRFAMRPEPGRNRKAATAQL